MSQTINLLNKRQSYKHKEKIFHLVRMITVFIGGICVTGLVVMLYLKTDAQLKNKALLTKKGEYLQELLTKKGIEKKIVYFDKKSLAFDKILKQDVNFLPYYNLLQSRLPTATGSAALSDVTYDNKGEVRFSLNFADYNSFYAVLTDFQNESFLDIFKTLTLESFTAGDDGGEVGYKIAFSGQLKSINDEKNN